MSDLMSQALAEAYAANPVDELVLDTLEFHHPAFLDDFGNPTAVRVVCANEEWQLGLEDSAPLNAGEMVTFYPVPFEFTAPSFEEGSVPTLPFSIANVSQEITKHLELAIVQTTPIKVYFRNYLSSDTSAPQIDPVIVMTLTSAEVGSLRVTGTATLSDVHNWPFPAQKYTPQRFPGLVR